ncbi:MULTISPECIES: LysR family transcriptional regulator [unclassified Rathayibacter]|uniref:LysR family transcriptional regulator n=1 Tax=unclassified Rathayibacter TaxID=2609250 RepID=UPI00188A1900|nr:MULTISPECIES: LysR family transcriptional regulator [unclassified Rathayibacter]MBF4463242.1 LysR family transcriptional regulator [Rathayibacter sp. VKM Ac-2879]MBF4504521.1 LysR family transcriptional regulator [Rathayibacter sp. VKM Ac-2878]
MDVDVPRLMVLRAVRDAGGVLAAADELHVSSSAVSQQLSKLERETGLALVARGANAPVRLTPAGRRLAKRADAIAAELRSARRDIAQLADQQQRTVRVGAFPSALQALVIPAAAALRSSGFDVQAIETRDETATLDSRLRSGDLDVVVIKQDGPQPSADGITETVVLDDPYRVVIPTAWTTPASFTDLLDRPWTGHPAGSPGRAALERLERQEGTALRIEHECTEYPVAIALAAAGLSASIVPQLVLTVMPHEGIRVVDLADVGSRRIVARQRDMPESTIAIDAVLDHLRHRPIL